MRIIPAKLAYLPNNPRIKHAPIIVSPQIFKLSTNPRIEGLETIHFATPENIHFASSRNAAEDQNGFIIFAIPSYSKCHPIKTRKPISPYNWISLIVVLFTSVCFLFGIVCFKIHNKNIYKIWANKD